MISFNILYSVLKYFVLYADSGFTCVLHSMYVLLLLSRYVLVFTILLGVHIFSTPVFPT